MLKIGNYNRLPVSRIVDFGLYLDAGSGIEILLPTRYITGIPKPGDEMDVFVYKDSENRLIATTVRPYATVGEFAYMTVKDTNNVGAFLDWGIMKDILVPFREQRAKMRKGGVYLVYVYLDDATKRIVASAKIEKFLGNLIPDYSVGDVVDALIIDRTDIGFKAIVDNKFYGMIYDSDIFKPFEIRQKIKACVKNVRSDGKIDLYPGEASHDRTETLSENILDYMRHNGGVMWLTDKSSPDEIKKQFSCSKKDFKKSIGHLYKLRLIEIRNDRIEVAEQA